MWVKLLNPNGTVREGIDTFGHRVNPDLLALLANQGLLATDAATEPTESSVTLTNGQVVSFGSPEASVRASLRAGGEHVSSDQAEG